MRRAGAEAPDQRLLALSDLLVGTWRVTGPDITGQAEYQTRKEGLLLVVDVVFIVRGTRMKVIQHIRHDEASDTLRAHYMDTMGDAAIYTWALKGRTIRISLGGEESETYFEASFNDDNSEYSGTWRYADGDASDSTETIVYSRV